MRAALAALLIAAAGSAAIAQSMNPAKVVALPSTPSTLRSTYGPDPRQFGELRLPPGKGPFPVAVVVHGGCWHKRFADLTIMSPLASALTARGFATWNIEYRMLGDPGGGWPGTFQDWGAATDHLRTLARTYPLDLKRVVAVGHSAGGHAAAWLATRPGIPKDAEIRGRDPLRIRTVVNIDGPSEITPFAGGRDSQICGMPVISDLMGGAPAAQGARYKLGDPGQRVPLKAPQLLVASTVLRAADAESYATRARAAGDRIEILDVTGTGHFDSIAPDTPTWTKVEAFIVDKALK
jgi:pimeloyl-ACP methyl ester carboxylesterase